jgi:hypothetical protein
MDVPAVRQLAGPPRLDARRERVPVVEPELAGNQLETVGMGDVDLPLVEESMHGLILIRASARGQCSHC